MLSSRLTSNLHIQTPVNGGLADGSHGVVIKPEETPLPSPNSSLGSPLKPMTNKRVSQLQKSEHSSLPSSSFSSVASTPRASKGPIAGPSGFDSLLLNQALRAEDTKKASLRLTFIQEVNALCGVICSTNFDKKYQEDHYKEKKGMSTLISTLAKMKERWDQVKGVEKSRLKFKDDFSLALECLEITLEKEAIDEFDDDIVALDGLYDDQTNETTKAQFDAPYERQTELDESPKSLPESPNTNAWLEEFKLRLNISKGDPSEGLFARIPTDQDLIAVKFLEEYLTL